MKLQFAAAAEVKIQLSGVFLRSLKNTGKQKDTNHSVFQFDLMCRREVHHS